MAKMIIDCTSAELSELLRLAEIARLLDAGQVSIQPGPPQSEETLSTHQKGRQAFESRARENGLTVRFASGSEVGHFIVEASNSVKAVRLICSGKPRFSLRKEWAELVDVTFAFVWLLPARARIFLMNYQEASAFLGDTALNSPSFKEQGYYTTDVNQSREGAIRPFEDRWGIFEISGLNESNPVTKTSSNAKAAPTIRRWNLNEAEGRYAVTNIVEPVVEFDFGLKRLNGTKLHIGRFRLDLNALADAGFVTRRTVEGNRVFDLQFYRDAVGSLTLGRNQNHSTDLAPYETN